VIYLSGGWLTAHEYPGSSYRLKRGVIAFSMGADRRFYSASA